MAPRKSTSSTSRTTRKRKKPLPTELWSALGPLAVFFDREGLDDDDFGGFSYATRVIKVDPDLHDAQKRHTLAHEWAHSIFWDSGLHNVLTHELEEQLCDAIATALVAANYF